MTFHQVDYQELEDWSFEQVVCSCMPKKRLIVYIEPWKNHMHFKLYVNREVVGRYNSLDIAVEEYNKV